MFNFYRSMFKFAESYPSQSCHLWARAELWSWHEIGSALPLVLSKFSFQPNGCAPSNSLASCMFLTKFQPTLLARCGNCIFLTKYVVNITNMVSELYSDYHRTCLFIHPEQSTHLLFYGYQGFRTSKIQKINWSCHNKQNL